MIIKPNATMTRKVVAGTKQARILSLLADDGPQDKHAISSTLGFPIREVTYSLQRKGLVGNLGCSGGWLWHLTPAGLAEIERVDQVEVTP